jgi:S1-C subfamily serine protease
MTDNARHAEPQAPLVKVWQRCRNSVVSLYVVRTDVKPSPKEKGKMVKTTRVQWGSGSIIHPGGYMLSNSHVFQIEGKQEVKFADGSTAPFRVIAVDEANDVALLKIDAGRPLQSLALGDSNGLRVGEPVAVIGNPFGMGHTLSAGFVTARHRSTKTEHAFLTDMVQTDAGVNPGNSGGPLLDMDGRILGMITSVKKEAENISFAIPIDKIRALFPRLVAPEGRYGFRLGMEVAAGRPVEIQAIEDDSPAAAAGLQAGDALTHLNGQSLREGLDFTLALIGHQGGETLPLTVERNGKPLQVAVTLGTVKAQPAAETAPLTQGLDFKLYHGQWKELPDFTGLEPKATGTMKNFGLAESKNEDHFALDIHGYIDIPAAGNYAFFTKSDDGSRLWIGDRMVVDNDGLHSAALQRGFIKLAKGKHPIRVTFFEATGEQALEVTYQPPDAKKKHPIPDSALFRPQPDAK